VGKVSVSCVICENVCRLEGGVLDGGVVASSDWKDKLGA